MDNSIKSVPRVSVQIVTQDLYLKRALNTLISECPPWLDSANPDDNNAVRVVLIDIACMWSSLAEQKDLMALLRSADAYALMSYSEASFNKVPHLNLSRQVTEIKLELVRLMITLTERFMPVMEGLFSCLNHSEHQVMRFLAYGYGIKEIHKVLGASHRLNVKSIYRLRSQVMKKYMLANHKELYAILRLYEFMQHMKDNILPAGIVRNTLRSEVTDWTCNKYIAKRGRQ